MKSLTVQIPKPCHERWADMRPNEQGRFCASCQKTVVDYTVLSDRELARVLNQSSGEICGQLRHDQINRPLVIPAQENSFWRHWLSIVTMGALSWQTAQAQSGQVVTPSRLATIQPLKSLATQEAIPGDTNQVTVSGRVMFADSTGFISAVPNATVLVKTIDPHVQTRKLFMSGVTDDAGRFNLLIPADWPINNLTLDVFAIGLSAHEVKTNVRSATATITLSDVLLTETMCVKRISISGGGIAVIKSPSRWQRLKRKFFHRAG